MALFIELLCPDGTCTFLRTVDIKRVETPKGLDGEMIASPNAPIIVHTKDGDRIETFGVSVMQILYGIHREDVFLDPRRESVSGGPPSMPYRAPAPRGSSFDIA